MKIAMNKNTTRAAPHRIAHESMAVQPLTLERNKNRSSFYFARVCYHFTEPIAFSIAQESTPGRQQNFFAAPTHSLTVMPADLTQLLPRNFSIIEVNFLRSQDLIVLVPFTRDQDQIAPLSCSQCNPNSSAPVLLNPIATFGLRAIVPQPVKACLLYAVLDFSHDPERFFGTGIVGSQNQKIT